MFDLDLYDKVVSFDVYPVTVLGNIYQNVKVLAIVDYETARLFSDVANTAVSVYPTLPNGTPKDFKKYKYLKVQHPNGAISMLATHWINVDTLTINKNVEITIKIKAKDILDSERVRDVLLANNFTILETTVT